jgi:hypothetical protein
VDCSPTPAVGTERTRFTPAVNGGNYHNPDEMQTLEVEHEEHTEELRRRSRRIRDRNEGDVPSKEA